MNVVFSNRAFASVLAETTEKVKTETGGLFLGSFENDTWYVIEAIDPGPNSIFQVAYFEYDQKYTQHLINKIANLYSESLSLIGLWHRHPGSFDVFSSTDDSTNSKYASMRNEGAISALVNIDPDFRLTVYHVESPCKYNKITYTVNDDLIPEKYKKLRTQEEYELLIKKLLYPEADKDEFTPSVSLKGFMESIKPYFKSREVSVKVKKVDRSNTTIMNKIIDVTVPDLTFLSDELGIKMSISQNGIILAAFQDTIDGIVTVYFTYSEKEQMFLFQYDKVNYVYEESLFQRLYNSRNQVDNDDSVICDTTTPRNGVEDIINGVIRLIHFDRKIEEEN